MIRLRIAHAAILLFFLLRAAVFAQVIDERALRIHREAIVVDAHADSLTRIIDAGDDLGARTDHGDIDIPRLREGGVDCQFFSIFAAPIFRTYGFFKRSIDLLDVYHNFVERYSQALAPARTIADVRLAVAQGKIATMLGVEGGQSIDNDLHILSIFSRLGVRYKKGRRPKPR